MTRMPVVSTITQRDCGRGRRPGAICAVLLLLLASCGPGATPAPSGPGPSSAAPTTSPGAPASTAPSISPSAPVTSGSPSAPAPTPPPSAPPIACSTLPFARASAAVAVGLTDVRVGSHAGYDRIVVEFAGTRLPAVRVEVVEPPFKLDPSDLPVTIGGSAFIQVKLTGVAVETVPAAAQDILAAAPVLVELRQTAGYEGDATWIAGLRGPSCARISFLTGPTRLVVDVARTGG